MTRPLAARAPSAQRSAVTNGTGMRVGINGCSALARRYRDLVEALSGEVGGSLTEADRLQVRNTAALQLHAEELTARIVRGEAVDPEAITRATNGATRALVALKRSNATSTGRNRSPARPGLSNYLATRASNEPPQAPEPREATSVITNVSMAGVGDRPSPVERPLSASHPLSDQAPAP